MRHLTSLKLAGIVTAIAVAMAVLAVHSIERTYPALVIVVGVAVTFVAITALQGPVSRARLCGAVGLLLALGLAYRLIPFLVASGPIGMDPHWFTVQVNRVLEHGHTDVVDSPYYSAAASFIILWSLIAAVTGMAAGNAILIIAAMAGIALPLFGTVLARRLTQPRAAFSAAIIVTMTLSVAQGSVRFSFWPIAQIHATALFLVFLFALIAALQTAQSWSGYRQECVLILTVIALSLTHKLLVLLAVLVLCGFVAWSWVWPLNNQQPSQLASASVLSLVLLLSVWALMTDFISIPILRFGLALGGVSETGYIPPAGTRIRTGTIPTVRRHINWITLVALGGIGWTWIVLREWQPWTPNNRDDLIPLIFAAAAIVPLLGLGVVAGFGVINPIRAATAAEPIMAVIIAVAFAGALSRSETDIRSYYHTIAIIAVIGLIVLSQVGASHGLPDESESPRSYLTMDERAAIEFANSTSPDDETIYTDSYASRAGINPDEPPEIYWRRDAGRFQFYEPVVFEGELGDDHDRVVIRSIQIYGNLPWGGYWVLDWDYRGALNECYSQIYDNSAGQMFVNNHC